MFVEKVSQWLNSLTTFQDTNHSYSSLKNDKTRASGSAEMVECHRLLQIVLDALRKNKGSGGNFEWRNFVETSTANGIELAQILAPDLPDICLLEELMARKEWTAVRFLWSRMQDGTYAQRRLKRTHQGLFTMKAGMNDGLSLYLPATGGMYCGEMKNGIMQGFGEMQYPFGEVFEGQWSVGKWHGPGAFRPFDGSSKEFRGVYIFGHLESDIRGSSCWNGGKSS